jgi:predicted amidophosphoribosyltransferase
VCDVSFGAPAPAHRCGRCLDRRPRFERAWGLFDYAGPVGDALRRGKYGRRPEAIEHIGRLVGIHLPTALLAAPPTSVVGVPLHPRRVSERGFSAPRVLACYVACSLGVPLRRRGLRRVRHTPPQAGLNDKARRRNVRGAFAVTRWVPDDVLLVDDVFTTGATVDAAAAALRAAGASRVRVVCAAYVERD